MSIRQSKTITKSDILESLELMDIKKGDVLLMHSALSSMGAVKGGSDTVIDAFLEAIGDEGTLAMSTLTGWFQPYDPDNSPSAVGLISEVFRNRPEALRSLHPVHSVAAIGKHAEYITEGPENCQTGCGEGTPYLKLRELGGKIVLLGVDNDRNTMMHSLEEAIDALYLRTLDIVAPVYWQSDTFTLKKFPPGHRDFLSVTRALRENDLLIEGMIGDACVKIIDIRGLFDLVPGMLKENPLLFICENEHCNSCHWSRLLYNAPDKIDLSLYDHNHCDDETCEICVI